MRKLLAVVAILGFATTAFGAHWSMNFADGPGGANLGTEANLVGSDIAWIDVWLHLGTADAGMQGYLYAFDANPPGPIVDFTWETFVPGPDIYEFNVPEQFNWEIDKWIGSGIAYPYPYYIPAPADILLASFDIHCTGEISEHEIFIQPGITNNFYFDNFGNQYEPGNTGIGTGVTIIQTPEPGSLALLALGGLALIRRR